MRIHSDAELFEQQLGAGESLVWTGRGSDRLLIRSDYFFVLVGAVLGVVAIGAFVSSLIALFGGDGATSFVGLIVSFLAGVLALFLMFGRLIRRYRHTQRIGYAITNRRVIQLTAAADRAEDPIASFVDFSDNPTTALQNHFERRGTIRVGTIKIENINDAAVVYELLSAELAKGRSI